MHTHTVELVTGTELLTNRLRAMMLNLHDKASLLMNASMSEYSSETKVDKCDTGHEDTGVGC